MIEHFRDPVKNIRDISETLKQGGVIIISTPNHNSLGAKLLGKKWLHWHVPFHLHFFTKESIKYLADKTGLELVKCYTITNYTWLNMQLMHLLNYPGPGQASYYWKERLAMDDPLKKNRLPTQLIKLMNKNKMFHILNKLLDLCGTGDNFIFILKKSVNDDGTGSSLHA